MGQLLGGGGTFISKPELHKENQRNHFAAPPRVSRVSLKNMYSVEFSIRFGKPGLCETYQACSHQLRNAGSKEPVQKCGPKKMGPSKTPYNQVSSGCRPEMQAQDLSQQYQKYHSIGIVNPLELLVD